MERIREFLIGKPLSEGNELEFPYGNYMETIRIGEVTPSGIAIVSKSTKFGDYKPYLFSSDIAYKQNLKIGRVDDKLRKVFEENNCTLSGAAEISKIDAKNWEITDGTKYYRIEDAGKQLEVYSQIERPKEPDHEDTIEDSSVSFDDIGGLDDIKNNLKEIAINVAHDPTFKSGNILLYGPPGTGKTMLAKAIAKEVRGKIIDISSGSILSKWFSESEKNVIETFSKARDWSERKKEPVIIFVDEIHSWTSEVAERDEHFGRVADEFKKQIENIADIREVFVVGATNYRERISRPFLDRFCTYQVEVPLPDKEARKKIFEIGLKEKHLADDIDYDELARLTEGLSGRNIKQGICTRAHMIASKGLPIEERKKGAKIKMEHLHAAIEKFYEERREKAEQEKYSVERPIPPGMFR